MKVGTQGIHAQLRICIVVGDVRFGALDQLAGGVQTAAAQHIMQLKAVCLQPLAEFIQAGKRSDRHNAGKIGSENIFYRNTAGAGQPHQAGGQFQQEQVAARRGKPRLLQPVDQRADDGFHLLGCAQLDRAGQHALVLLLKRERGGGLRLQVADIDDPAATAQHAVIECSAPPSAL